MGIEDELRRIPNVVRTLVTVEKEAATGDSVVILDISLADVYGKLSPSSKHYSVGVRVGASRHQVLVAGKEEPYLTFAEIDRALACLRKQIDGGQSVLLCGPSPTEFVGGL